MTNSKESADFTIAFDGKRAANNRTGLGNYSRHIIGLLAKYFPQYRYAVFLTKPNGNPQFQDILNHNPNIEVVVPKKGFWKKFSSLWRTFGIKNEISEFDNLIYHGLSNELPLTIKKTNAKSIVTIHDLIFLKYPKYYKFFDRKIYTYKFRKACENADRIIAVSECTKKDIVEIFKIDPAKITVIYQGCDKVFKSEIQSDAREIVRKKYNLPERFLLNVGSIEERKNAMLIVDALPLIQDKIPLVIVGKRTAYTLEVEKKAAQLGVKDRLIILDKVPFEDLAPIYHLGEVFIYPSRYEGFGIPIIEAINCGVPVIAATGSCLEEAGGPDCVYVNPDDARQLALAIDKMMTDKVFRENSVGKSKLYVNKFSEEKQAEQLMECYGSLIKKK
ncbi:MAG: glycosyltransferase family 4 protein [Bacteroidales bacterium]|nr:glycosyltransferase family 4 protein [Bacteroidales bacterium]